MNTLVSTLITGAFPLGAFFGAFFGGWLLFLIQFLKAPCSKVLGRRMSMIYCDLIALIGVMFTMLGPYVLVIIGRFIVGFTVGINCTAVTMYINELSPASLSGLMGA